MADNLHTALHEIIGHGSGKVAVPKDPSTYLREYYSTLEEARADLVAYWNIYDPKLAELGVADVQEVGHELYRQLARAGLTPLKNYSDRATMAQEDHDRSRLLVANYLIESGALKRVQKNGHWYNEVTDYDKAHEAVGKLLAEIMRIKGTGDYDGIKALVDKYGTHFDPAVRDDVVARYKKLDIPIYVSGVYANLAPVKDKAGKVTDVKSRIRTIFSPSRSPGLGRMGRWGSDRRFRWPGAGPSSPRPSSPGLPPVRREKREKLVKGKSQSRKGIVAPLSRRTGGRLGERGWGVRASPKGATLPFTATAPPRPSRPPPPSPAPRSPRSSPRSNARRGRCGTPGRR